MGYKPPVGVPDHIPGNHDPHRDAVLLGALTMIVIVFLGLVGQGFPPREALAVTIALGMGGAETAKRVANARDNKSGNGR